MYDSNSEKLRFFYTCGVEKPHEEMVKGSGQQGIDTEKLDKKKVKTPI